MERDRSSVESCLERIERQLVQIKWILLVAFLTFVGLLVSPRELVPGIGIAVLMTAALYALFWFLEVLLRWRTADRERKLEATLLREARDIESSHETRRPSTQDQTVRQ